MRAAARAAPPWRAAPDGLTLLVTANSHVINPAVLRSLPFDTLADFTPIIRLADGPFVMVAHPAMGVRDLAGFLAAVRARPGHYNYGSPGHGTGNHLAMERLIGLGGLRMTHVPYGGAAPATTALLSGEVQVLINNLPNSLPHIAEGRMVPLGIGSLAPAPVLPNLPPIATTFPGFTAENWYAVFAPAGLDPERAEAIHAAAARAMRSAAVLERLGPLGITPAAGPRADFARQVAEEVAEWRRVARAAGIEPG
ncbi:MAG: tripartite tricarboxylate transporter substrate-binding protein [Rubritepida sp.]|nr:tripartite tricarboxylate transporter substrate-binding protein [Rubritepida sp.]